MLSVSYLKMRIIDMYMRIKKMKPLLNGSTDNHLVNDGVEFSKSKIPKSLNDLLESLWSREETTLEGADLNHVYALRFKYNNRGNAIYNIGMLNRRLMCGKPECGSDHTYLDQEFFIYTWGQTKKYVKSRLYLSYHPDLHFSKCKLGRLLNKGKYSLVELKDEEVKTLYRIGRTSGMFDLANYRK